MPTQDFDKAQRLLNQLKPVLEATDNLQASYAAGIKEPPGHPNLHPVRLAMKELEMELERAIGQIARSRREDDLERQRRQAQYKNK